MGKPHQLIANKNVVQFIFIRWITLGLLLPILSGLDASHHACMIIFIAYIPISAVLLAWLTTRHMHTYIQALNSGSPRLKNTLALICLVSIVLTFGFAAISGLWLHWKLTPAGEYAVKFMSWLIMVTGIEAFFCEWHGRQKRS